MRTHTLKLHAPLFDDVAVCNKNFEVRKNDRAYAVGDRLELLEVCPLTCEPSGRYCFRTVDYILPGGQYGIEKGYVVLGLQTLRF